MNLNKISIVATLVVAGVFASGCSKNEGPAVSASAPVAVAPTASSKAEVPPQMRAKLYYANMFSRFDLDKSGTVSLPEFKTGMLKSFDKLVTTADGRLTEGLVLRPRPSALGPLPLLRPQPPQPGSSRASDAGSAEMTPAQKQEVRERLAPVPYLLMLEVLKQYPDKVAAGLNRQEFEAAAQLAFEKLDANRDSSVDERDLTEWAPPPMRRVN